MCVCVCAIFRCTFVFAVYLFVLYMCAQIRIWSCFSYFGLFTEIAVCKLLSGLAAYGPKPCLFCPLYVFIHFSAAFCTTHCALDLARDQGALEMSLLWFYVCVGIGFVD